MNFNSNLIFSINSLNLSLKYVLLAYFPLMIYDLSICEMFKVIPWVFDLLRFISFISFLNKWWLMDSNILFLNSNSLLKKLKVIGQCLNSNSWVV